MEKTWRWITRSLLWLLIPLASLGIVMLVAAGWYRAADHADRLTSARAESFEVLEISVSDSAGVRGERFRLRDSRGRIAEGYLSYPLSAEEPLPAVLILGGHGTGARAVELVDLDSPAVLCGIDYPAIPDYRVSPLRIPSLLSSLDSLVLASTAMAFTAVDYLVSRPEVGPGRLTVLGASFGVPFAVIAGLDKRLDGMVLIYGGADMGRIIDWNLRGKIESAPLRWLAGYILGTFTAPYEPSKYIGRFSPRPVLIINGSGDTRIPERSARELFAAAGEPREQVWVQGGHIHPNDTKLIGSLTTEVSRWLRTRGLL